MLIKNKFITKYLAYQKLIQNMYTYMYIICYFLVKFRFCHDVFDRDYKATIGVDFEVEKFSVLAIPFNLQV